MCGRFVRHSNVNEFTELVADLTYSGLEPKPHYHVAPSQLCLVASEHADSDKRELVTLKWGLVPNWSKDAKVGYQLINARSERAVPNPLRSTNSTSSASCG